MGFVKTISYSHFFELYEYEDNIRDHVRNSTHSKIKTPDRVLVDSRGDSLQQIKQRQAKRRDNARRTSMDFRRLISANLGESVSPLFITLTYPKQYISIDKGHNDFNTFARNMRHKFGDSIRYVAVPEWQKNGTLHFHALYWGLQNEVLVSQERQTRMVASMWGQGFIDLTLTDGDIKLAFYMAKYMQKAIFDDRLLNKKAFVCSRNCIRPVIEKGALVSPLFYGDLIGSPNLSEAELLTEKVYMTQWLGKGRFRFYKI